MLVKKREKPQADTSGNTYKGYIIFKSISRFIKSLFHALETGSSALDNSLGVIDELATATRKSTEVLCDNVVSDLQIDKQIDDAKRARRVAKAEAKTERILAEIKAMKP